MARTRFEQEFDLYSDWRLQVQDAIRDYHGWLQEQKLADAHVDQRVEQLLSTLHDDKLYVAFVAEFSRGKSELINAIFFGGMGLRIVPSGAGRTTMCPTELMYDPDFEPSIRLLPIETRNNDTAITEYKQFPEEWDREHAFPLDADMWDEQIAARLA